MIEFIKYFCHPDFYLFLWFYILNFLNFGNYKKIGDLDDLKIYKINNIILLSRVSNPSIKKIKRMKEYFADERFDIPFTIYNTVYNEESVTLSTVIRLCEKLYPDSKYYFYNDDDEIKILTLKELKNKIE